LTVIRGSHRLVKPIMELRLMSYVASFIFAHVFAWICRCFCGCFSWLRAEEIHADAGDLLIMEPNVVHSSSLNVSGRIRLSLQFKSGGCGVDVNGKR